MQFSRLRLTGFKSFVDPTDLVIAGGLTGVVGPNGCGKSNLLEALRWVMGENRPTAMRGGGMEDVIFAGAATRPARHFAEVSLLIDNSERLAPAGFNDHDTLEVIRRITRDVGSAYKANGKDVRARDVQMLFADASTGAHSPALVRQGQISELINARPRNRRRILEEAAGISGLYQRRHEAELKLNAAETNLARVDDVVGQLATQLAQLARQARQAARYRAIGVDLRKAEGLLLYRHWRDAQDGLESLQAALRTCLSEAAYAEKDAREAEAAKAEQEAKLPDLRKEENVAGAILQRAEVEQATLQDTLKQARKTITTLDSRLVQLSRDIEREGALNQDAGGTIERLQAEQNQLEKADDGHEERLAEGAAQVREAGAQVNTLEERLTTATEEAARLAARYQGAERFAQESRTLLERSQAEASKAREAVGEAGKAVAQARQNAQSASAAESAARDEASRAQEALTEIEHAREEAQAREAEARAQRASDEGEAKALSAEVAALARLVERDSGAGRQLLDRLQVEHGFEKALGAALSDDLRATEAEPGASGWHALPPYDTVQPLPDGITPLSNHVSEPEVLGRRMNQIGIVDQSEGAAFQPHLRPGQRLVSVEGDLWRWDGFCAGARDAPTAAALRLEQLNRLVALRRDLEEISARAEGTRLAHERLSEELRTLTTQDQQARTARREADKRMADSARALSKAQADETLSQGRLESLGLAVSRYEEAARDAQTQLESAQAALLNLPDLESTRAKVTSLRGEAEAARQHLLTLRGQHEAVQRAAHGRARRREQIAKDLKGWRKRAETAESRLADLQTRKRESGEELSAAREVPAALEARGAALASTLDTARTRLAAAQDALSAGEGALRQAEAHQRDTERAASQAREARAAAQARVEAAEEAVLQAQSRIEEEMTCAPRELLERLDTLPENVPAAEKLDTEVGRLKRQRDALGAVNLRAEEDAREMAGEHEELLREKGDLEEAIKALRSGIAGLNKEGRERLLTAFEQVNSSFSVLFTHLFGGGEARLELVESDDPLEAGLEIMCQPPGKKLSTLSLLSGGEQTLTALALIFAVFLANPAPICVLDEVDAPLDDANVTRFCDLLDEMCRRTQTRFLIITHHAVTMARMDRLFGVTMAEQGVSQLVSVDLRKAEAMVA